MENKVVALIITTVYNIKYCNIVIKTDMWTKLFFEHIIHLILSKI